MIKICKNMSPFDRDDAKRGAYTVLGTICGICLMVMLVERCLSIWH